MILGVIGPYSSSSLAHVVNTYCRENLSLVSPSATTSIYDLRQSIKDLKQVTTDKDQQQCFFRIPETSKKAVDVLIKYLEQPNNTKQYARAAIFSIEGDTHPIYFRKYLRDKINRSKLSLETKEDIVFGNAKKTHERRTWIKENIKTLKKNHKEKVREIALFLIEGAKDSTLQDTIDVIESNNGESLILGNNSVYDPDLFDELDNKHEKSKEDLIKKMVIAVPSFTPKSNIPNSNKDLTWYSSMSSDATQILIDTIEKESNNGSRSIEREGVQKQFNSDNFQIETDEKIIKLKDSSPNEKIIKLKDSSPKNPPSDLIQPNCSTSPCRWEKINLDDKPKQKFTP